MRVKGDTMNRPTIDTYTALVRYAHHYLMTARRFRLAGDLERARQCIDNGQKAVEAAEKESRNV